MALIDPFRYSDRDTRSVVLEDIGRARGVVLRDGSIRYLMSPGTRALGWVARAMAYGFVSASLAVDELPDKLISIAAMWIFLMLVLINCGGRIVVSDFSVVSRNLVTLREYSWASIKSFEPTAKVTVLESSGKRSNCWAVQRANVSAWFNRVSRVDNVVQELEAYREKVGIAADRDAKPRVRIIRFSTGELIELLGAFPLLVGLGVWLLG